jgi:hypothetical protein
MLEIAKLDLVAIKSNSLVLNKSKASKHRYNLWMMQMSIRMMISKTKVMKKSPLQRKEQETFRNHKKGEVLHLEIRSKNRMIKLTTSSILARVILLLSNIKINKNSRNY